MEEFLWEDEKKGIPSGIKFGRGIFDQFLRGEVMWKSFDDVKIDWIFLKRMILLFQKRDFEWFKYYTKEISREYITSFRREYPEIECEIQEYLMFEIGKHKQKIVQYVQI